MTGSEPRAAPGPSSLARQEQDFTAEGAPPPSIPVATTPEDCMFALDQLDTKLDMEIGRRRLLEQEVRTT